MKRTGALVGLVIAVLAIGPTLAVTAPTDAQKLEAMWSWCVREEVPECLELLTTPAPSATPSPTPSPAPSSTATASPTATPAPTATIGPKCWGMELITQNGCPNSLYVELSILDEAGTSVGYTNDTTSALSPGQRAKMLFESFEDDAHSARLTEVTCY